MKDSLVTLINNGVNFNKPLWEQCLRYGVAIFDILQDVDIPAGKKICEKGDFRKKKKKKKKKLPRGFFVAIWQETPIYAIQQCSGHSHNRISAIMQG